jgi:thymidylate synthase (FAD)
MNTTARPTVPALEAILNEPIPVLDHGFVRVLDYMGDDQAIADSARVSYGLGTRSVSDNTGLIRYLMRHRHSTPFEMCEIKYHVKLPIFVARQWIRHRTANVNEISARYSILDREFYIPSPDNLAVQSTSNKQGRGDVLEADDAAAVLQHLRYDADRCHDTYEWALKTKNLSRELARMNLTINTYTQWYWKTDLHNLFHFLSLRADAHAQYEIRVYAEAMLKTVQAWVPLACEAFRDYRLDAVTLSRQGLDVVRRMIAGLHVHQASSGMGQREWAELMGSLGLTVL